MQIASSKNEIYFSHLTCMRDERVCRLKMLTLLLFLAFITLATPAKRRTWNLVYEVNNFPTRHWYRANSIQHYDRTTSGILGAALLVHFTNSIRKFRLFNVNFTVCTFLNNDMDSLSRSVVLWQPLRQWKANRVLKHRKTMNIKKTEA